MTPKSDLSLPRNNSCSLTWPGCRGTMHPPGYATSGERVEPPPRLVPSRGSFLQPTLRHHRHDSAGIRTLDDMPVRHGSIDCPLRSRFGGSETRLFPRTGSPLGGFHPLSQAERPHVGPHLLDVGEALPLRPALPSVAPTQRVLPMSRPNGILFFVVHHDFVSGRAFFLVCVHDACNLLSGIYVPMVQRDIDLPRVPEEGEAVRVCRFSSAYVETRLMAPRIVRRRGSRALRTKHMVARQRLKSDGVPDV